MINSWNRAILKVRSTAGVRPQTGRDGSVTSVGTTRVVHRCWRGSRVGDPCDAGRGVSHRGQAGEGRLGLDALRVRESILQHLASALNACMSLMHFPKWSSLVQEVPHVYACTALVNRMHFLTDTYQRKSPGHRVYQFAPLVARWLFWCGGRATQNMWCSGCSARCHVLCMPLLWTPTGIFFSMNFLRSSRTGSHPSARVNGAIFAPRPPKYCAHTHTHTHTLTHNPTHPHTGTITSRSSSPQQQQWSLALQVLSFSSTHSDVASTR